MLMVFSNGWVGGWVGTWALPSRVQPLEVVNATVHRTLPLEHLPHQLRAGDPHHLNGLEHEFGFELRDPIENVDDVELGAVELTHDGWNLVFEEHCDGWMWEM